MRSIQQSLPFSALSPVKDRDSAINHRKHLLIKGRPRRLKTEYEGLTAEVWGKIVDGISGELELVDDWDLTSNAVDAIPVVDLAAAIAEHAQRSEVIKVAIPPRVVEVLDRIRTKLAGSATRPEIVRMVAEEFVDAHRHLIGKDLGIKREKRIGLPGRCDYVKIAFPHDVVTAIGHQDDHSGLCAVFNTTRQGVISRAINWYLDRMK